VDSTDDPKHRSIIGTATEPAAGAKKKTKAPTALRDRVRERISREGLSQRAVAREAGVAVQVLNRWLASKSREGEEQDTTNRMTAWLDAHKIAESPSRRDAGFVNTPTARKIIGALTYCRSTGDMACVYGGPGVGKTRSIHHFRGGHPENVWVATMTPASAGLVSALEVVADAVGVTEAAGGARRISNAIRAQVSGRGGIIIIDESQHLSMAAIEELRSIHDVGRVGLCLIGNETSYARLTGGSRAASYAQIFSRIGMRVFIHRPESADVRELAEHMGVHDKDALELLERLAARPGALRGAVKAITLATSYAAGGAVTVKTLRDAMRTLGAEV
jgi:DNA transposition AAA+ family ATPase